MPRVNLVPEGNPEELWTPPDFPVLSPGKHSFVVANNLEITEKEETGNGVIKLEARCQDEGDEKGIPVFENIVIVVNPVTDKAMKAKKIHDKKLAQFTVACGVLTREQVEAGEGIELDEFKDKMFLAISGVRAEKYKGEDIKRAYIKRYLLEDEPEDSNAA